MLQKTKCAQKSAALCRLMVYGVRMQDYSKTFGIVMTTHAELASSNIFVMLETVLSWSMMVDLK
jgi:hypothetical protein